MNRLPHAFQQHAPSPRSRGIRIDRGNLPPHFIGVEISLNRSSSGTNTRAAAVLPAPFGPPRMKISFNSLAAWNNPQPLKELYERNKNGVPFRHAIPSDY